jgi:hypothetical protein
MAETSPSTAALRTLRQRGSVALGIIATVLCVGIVVTSVVTRSFSLVFDGFMLLGAACGWVLFTRPSLAVSLAGVHVNNPIRRTVVPWARVDDVATRWNLEVYTDTGASYAAWAISSHIQRPRGAGILGFNGVGRQAMTDSTSQAPPSDGATVRSAAQSVELARDEWSEMVADGRPEVSPEGQVTRTWELTDIALLGLPILLIVLGFLG